MGLLVTINMPDLNMTEEDIEDFVYDLSVIMNSSPVLIGRLLTLLAAQVWSHEAETLHDFHNEEAHALQKRLEQAVHEWEAYLVAVDDVDDDDEDLSEYLPLPSDN